MLAEGMTEPANTWHILELKISSLCHLRHAKLGPAWSRMGSLSSQTYERPVLSRRTRIAFWSFLGCHPEGFSIPEKLEQVRPVEIPQNSCPSHYRAATTSQSATGSTILPQRLERKLAQATGRHTGWLFREHEGCTEQSNSQRWRRRPVLILETEGPPRGWTPVTRAASCGPSRKPA